MIISVSKAMQIKKNILITLQHYLSNSTQPKHRYHYWKQEQVYFFVVNPIHLGDLRVTCISFCRIMPIRWFLIFVDLFTLPQSSRSLIPPPPLSPIVASYALTKPISQLW